ncbi:MAG: glycosyltransferase family 4 protein [bacterium]|nr:glycosyltransferase family 4 protein [bacterium]
MKILFAPAHYFVSDKRGSEPSWPYYALKALGERGHEVWAICGVADLNDRQIHPNVHLISIFGQARTTNALVEIWRKVQFYRQVAKLAAKIIADEDIEVVHHFAPISPLSPNLLAAKGSFKNIPFTMGPAMKPPDEEADLATALGTPDDWRLKLSRPVIGLLSQPAANLYRRTLQHVDHLFAVTAEAAVYYRQSLPKTKVSVVPAGIDISKYASPPAGIKHNNQIVLAVCYLIKRKGIDVLLSAWSRIVRFHPRARLWVVGNGPEEDNLKKLARELQLESKVRFWGFVDNKKVGRYYAEAGIFVSPTRAEPFGQTLLEAMAAGLPLVASATGGIIDIVTKEVGYTFPVDDVERLATALDKLLREPKQIKQMSDSALERVKKVYDWSVIVAQYEQKWQSLIRQKNNE